MNRRGFLTAMLAAGAAPYVMSSAIGRGVLMPVREIKVATEAEIRAVMGELHRRVMKEVYGDLQWTEYEMALARSIHKGGASIINILPRLYQ